MLENFVKPITYLKVVTTQAGQFKSKNDTTLTYEQYSKLLLLSSTTHDNKFKPGSRFSSKSWYNV